MAVAEVIETEKEFGAEVDALVGQCAGLGINQDAEAEDKPSFFEELLGIHNEEDTFEFSNDFKRTLTSKQKLSNLKSDNTMMDIKLT